MSSNWWQSAVIYQIYPRSFCDSNSDGIGDLQGIMQKLDYIEALGVDAIWISPFFLSPMKDFGYDVQDYRKVDPIFGVDQDFDELLDKCHEKGIKVIIDMVLNHTSDQHTWFCDSREQKNGREDWYVWADEPPNNWLSAFGGSAWSFDDKRQKYYYHHFLSEQPDLNFHNKDVQEALLEECRFWFEKGVDGFRLDVCNLFFHDQKLRDNPKKEKETGKVQHEDNPYNAYRHVYDRSRPETLVFLERLRALADQYSDRFLLAEIFSDNSHERVKEYSGESGPLHSAYSFELLTNELESGQFKSVVERSEGFPCWSIGNHDIERVASRWGSQKAVFALLMGLKGSLCLYQGDELGLPEADVPFEKLQDPFGKKFYPEYKGRDGCRTPIPWDEYLSENSWLPIDEKHLSLSVKKQLEDANSNLQFVTSLLHWRRERGSEWLGSDLQFLVDESGLIAFLRGSTLFIGNLSPEERTFSLRDRGISMNSIHFQHSTVESEHIILPSDGYLIADI